MKRFYLVLCGNILFAIALFFITLDTLHLVRETGDSQFMGIISLSAAGPGASAGLVGLLTLLFAIDFLWILFFALWLVKKWARIKDQDNTLYLP
ncbi:MAG TPA: hypothetical protein VD706_02770 [Candidatus Saccharimonadales bacterium]|nr:hypothetical protein [Candidatus Saccharimonadales bacterium]